MRVEVPETSIFLRRGGSGPPLLLLHGFPETHEMWRQVAPRLAAEFSVVCADLRGYGRSGCPPSSADDAPYSKRALAADMVAAMATLGFPRFAVAGHDRGGRVAYRAALDHPDAVAALAVLDVIPVDVAWERADDRFALGFWPWSLLAQSAPLPESLLLGAPEAVIESALGGDWGSPAESFEASVREAYLQPLRDPQHVRAICEEYRAGAGIDREHDAADRAAGRRIACPVLALWSAAGPLGDWYEETGGPAAIWGELCERLQAEAVAGGHFFPEEHPAALAERLARFLA